MKKAIGFYPCPDVDTAASAVVSHAGTLLLTETIGRVGLDRTLSAALEPWRPRFAVHDPAKILLDLALGLAVGGDCLADVALLLRAEPTLFGPVASDSDGVTHDRPPRHRRLHRPGGDRHRSRRRPSEGLGAGR
ncbi:hypothetical protein GCM10023175_28250 [Pseudonocardia xishanensis]|uniref:Transposase DDE domain-containing protein n=1 Tax=Pseudonocardia xishanensis TaxID=630995 RepID=A0ABP8RSL5_9PSEU